MGKYSQNNFREINFTICSSSSVVVCVAEIECGVCVTWSTRSVMSADMFLEKTYRQLGREKERITQEDLNRVIDAMHLLGIP